MAGVILKEKDVSRCSEQNPDENKRKMAKLGSNVKCEGDVSFDKPYRDAKVANESEKRRGILLLDHLENIQVL